MKNQSLGESNFQQQVTYQRALQGQLEQTIDNIQGVSGAQVELVLPNPQNQLFGENQNAASAAVLLSAARAAESSTSVRGIAQLVASSVPGLQIGKVTITDGTGQLLWPSPERRRRDVSQRANRAPKNATTTSMEANLDAMLAQTLGPGKAEVQVNADAEHQPDHAGIAHLRQGRRPAPADQEPRNARRQRQRRGRRRDRHREHPGLRPNRRLRASPTTSTKSAHSTLGVDKTVTHSTIAPGAVESQHVSVLLDHTVPAASVPAIKEAVTNAAGIQAKRGDTISIGQMAFAKPTARPPAAAGSGPLGYAKYALIGIASAIFLFFTTRTLRRREQEPIDHAPRWLRELELPIRLSELQRETPRARPRHSHRRRLPASACRRRQPRASPGRAARREQPRARRPAAAQLDAGGLMPAERSRQLTAKRLDPSRRDRETS